jgi:hypothetical protein
VTTRPELLIAGVRGQFKSMIVRALELREETEIRLSSRTDLGSTEQASAILRFS